MTNEYDTASPITLEYVAEQNERILHEMHRLREDIRFVNIAAQRCNRSLETILPPPPEPPNGMLKAARITLTIASALAVVLIVLLAYGRAEAFPCYYERNGMGPLCATTPPGAAYAYAPPVPEAVEPDAPPEPPPPQAEPPLPRPLPGPPPGLLCVAAPPPEPWAFVALNVRYLPNGPVIGTLMAGHPVRLTGQFWQNWVVADNGWGLVGWVFAPYLACGGW